MQKKLIALALASAFAAPAAFAATSNVDVYGVLGISIEDTNQTTWQVTDRQSRFGIKGSEDLGGGLKAIWQIEQAVSAVPSGNDGVGGATLANRNTYVGLSGNFGTFLVGRHDTPYKLTTSGKLDFFADTMADTNVAENFRRIGVDYDYGVAQTGTTVLVGNNLHTLTSNVYALIDPVHDYRSPTAIAYVSPKLAGFTISAAAVATNLGANIARNGALSLGNLASGDDNIDATSASVTYENGPLYLAVGYQDVNLIDSTAWRFGAGYTLGDLKLGAVYESVDNALIGHTCQVAAVNGTVGSIGYSTVSACVNGGNTGVELADRHGWYVNAAYTMGQFVFKGLYGKTKIDDTSNYNLWIPDVTTWAVGVDYNLSKRSNVYALYRSTSLDGKADLNMGDDVKGVAIGVRHTF